MPVKYERYTRERLRLIRDKLFQELDDLVAEIMAVTKAIKAKGMRH